MLFNCHRVNHRRRCCFGAVKKEPRASRQPKAPRERYRTSVRSRWLEVQLARKWLVHTGTRTRLQNTPSHRNCAISNNRSCAEVVPRRTWYRGGRTSQQCIYASSHHHQHFTPAGRPPSQGTTIIQVVSPPPRSISSCRGLPLTLRSGSRMWMVMGLGLRA